MHKRGEWATAGSPFYGATYSLGCSCGWRSDWTRLHYEAEMALKAHIEHPT